MRYNTYHDGKHFVFEGEGVKVKDANVHALMQKIKRLKIGIESEEGKHVTKQRRQRANTA